jgi:hypothetical protein
LAVRGLPRVIFFCTKKEGFFNCIDYKGAFSRTKGV